MSWQQNGLIFRELLVPLEFSATLHTAFYTGVPQSPDGLQNLSDTSPTIKKETRSPKQLILDEFVKSVLRRMVSEIMSIDKVLPTTATILKAMLEANLRSIIKKVGFRGKKFETNWGRPDGETR